ncbi:hypothetical protein L7F22_041057 [Adiantum nelumboides]|nr:hypothetical protein [Adiantum nelumboides]
MTKPHVLLALLLLCPIASTVVQASFVDDLPGWMGEIRTKVTSSSAVKHGGEAFVVDPTKVVQLSWKPRAFLYEGFLSNEECEHLKKLAKSKLEKSMVADNESGKSVLSQIRTSSGMFINKGHDAIVTRIEERIAIWTFLPIENGEALQVLRYQHAEKYEPHYDFFHDKKNQALGGHRVATVLMYLSNVEKGGETVFPNAPDPRVKNDSWSECARRALSVHPRKGDALLFFSLNTEAVPDILSLHGSCPVIEGEKWSATKWIHVGSFGWAMPKPTGCADEHERCAEWAAAGECTKNPAYMVGSDQYAGACRKSCKVC